MTLSYLTWYPTAVSLCTLHQRTWKGKSFALSTTMLQGNVLRGVRGRPSILERGFIRQGVEGGVKGRQITKQPQQTAQHCL